MDVKQVSVNVLLLETNHGDEVLYYYNEPIAGYSHILGSYFRIQGKWDEQINKYLISKGNLNNVLVLTQKDVINLFSGEHS